MLADDPQLTVRDADGRNAARQPLRVVVDRGGRLPGHRPRAGRRRAHAGQPRRQPPPALLAELFDRDVRRVLLEGGPTLAAAFLRERAGRRGPWCTSRRSCSGAGPSLVGDLGIRTIADALDLTIAEVTLLGGDVQLRLRPTRHTGGRQHADGGS